MTDLRPHLLLYCQGSVGLGHLTRTLALAAGLEREFRVVVLYGGRLPSDARRADGVEIVSLPPLRTDDERRLVTVDGRAHADVDAERRRIITRTLHETQPRVLVIELFPFGRRKLAGELLALLAEARSLGRPPLVVSSVRDVLVRGRRDQARFESEASKLANRWFDLVLVHSDPRHARFEESFTPAVPLRVPVRHTGFVHEPRLLPEGPRDGVVVSAGGGAAGAPLLLAAARAHALLPTGTPLTIVAGPFAAPDVWASLAHEAACAGPGLVLRRSVPDLPRLLAGAAASVSQCGYNTALDVLVSGAPALVVPFAAPGEDEQTRRAARLAGLGAIRVLDQADLTPGTLAREILRLREFSPTRVELRLDGAERSAAILARLAGRELRAVAS